MFLGGDTNQSVSEQHSIERLFLAGELQSLPVGYAVVKIANYPVSKVQFENIYFPEQIAGFIQCKVQFASVEELETAQITAEPTPKENTLQSPTEDGSPKTFKF